jgi:hypothetical protein
MRKSSIAALGAFFGLTLSTLAGHATLGVDASAQATQRYVAGVITAIDGRNVTIDGKSRVTAHVNETTRITINGRPAKASDLKITESAKAELGIDDVWATIAASTK